MENFITGLGSSLNLNDQSTAVSVTKVVVDMSPNELFEDVCKAYYNEVHRVTRFEGKTSVLSRENVSRYFKTILKLHIDNVNRDKSVFAYKQSDLIIPTIVISILLNIGEVTDKDYGLKFIPKFDIDSNDLMSKSEFEDFADELVLLERVGLKFTTDGLPIPKDSGTLGFMGSQLLNKEDVRSYRHDHPVFGFFKSMFNTSALEEILGVKSLRVRYGYYDQYSTLIKAFVSDSKE